MSSVLSMINCTAIKIQMETVRMGFVADKTMLTLHQISNLYFSGGEGVGGGRDLNYPILFLVESPTSHLKYWTHSRTIWVNLVLKKSNVIIHMTFWLLFFHITFSNEGNKDVYFTGITGKNTINIVYLNKLSSTRVYGPKGKKKRKWTLKMCASIICRRILYFCFLT